MRGATAAQDKWQFGCFKRFLRKVFYETPSIKYIVYPANTMYYIFVNRLWRPDATTDYGYYLTAADIFGYGA